MALCEYKIAHNIDNSCDIIGGLREIGYITNKSDISSYTEAKDIISDLAMKEDCYLYKIYTPTNQPFNGTNTAMEEGTVVNRFTNTASFIVLEHDSQTAITLENLANGRFVAFIANEYEGNQGESKWQVYGIERGLKATEIARDPYSEDQAGGWAVTMQETGAAKAAHFLYLAAGLEATEEFLESLTEDYEPEETPGN